MRVPLSQAQASPLNWRRVLQEAVRDVSELAVLLELDIDEVLALSTPVEHFPLLVPRGFVARMRKGDIRDPLLAQILPQAAERLHVPGFSNDPLREHGLADHGVMQKYAGRALLIASGVCPVHCRYCFRRAFPYQAQIAIRDDWRGALTKLEDASDVTEVILSGGDPLSVSNRRLASLLDALESIESVQCVRIHTRFPIMVPERIDEELGRMLDVCALKTVVVVHCNHPNELDSTVEAALLQLSQHVDLLLNQSVLLRSINDEVEILTKLSYKLFSSGVLPYYLHMLDSVSGTAHFAVDAGRANALIAAVRGQLPGYLVPKLVREAAGGLSKTPL